MPKEILLYSSIYSYSAADFIGQLNDNKGSDIVVRINANGGDPEYGFGMIAKFKEHPKGKLIKVDGKAHSMYAFMLCYADNVECLDVSTFTVHRAAYGSWFEADPELFNEARKDELNKVNAYLRAGLEAKIDVAKFVALKGVTMDQIFSLDSRIDVTLTADEAKAVGLVNTITAITPQKRAEIADHIRRIAAEATGLPAETPTESQPKNSNKMTLAELRAQHPEVYAAAVKEGVDAERDRTGALMAYADADLETVKTAITEGKPLTQTMMAEMGRKLFAKQALGAIEADSTKEVKTTETTAAVTAAAKAKEDFDKEWKANLKKFQP